MKEIRKIKTASLLTKKEQQSIQGGIGILDTREACACIVLGPRGYLEIVPVDCDSLCPDGSQSISGLAY
ncbi:hypothetical protein [Aquimarina rhabdastrellae]